MIVVLLSLHAAQHLRSAVCVHSWSGNFPGVRAEAIHGLTFSFLALSFSVHLVSQQTETGFLELGEMVVQYYLAFSYHMV